MIGYSPQEIVNPSTATELIVSLETNSNELTEITFVGTRGAGRAKTETPVPIDVIRINQVGLPTAWMDLTSELNYSSAIFQAIINKPVLMVLTILTWEP